MEPLADSPDATGSRGMPKSEFCMCHSHMHLAAGKTGLLRRREIMKSAGVIQVKATLKNSILEKKTCFIAFIFFKF
jgi:hypothetical protein